MFLAQARNTDRSCQNSVNQSAIQKVAGGLLPGSTCTGGYCRARKQLPENLISHLTRKVGSFKGKGSDEQTLLRSIMDTFEAGDIVMGDAFFATYFFIAEMQARGVDILMEQHGARKRSTDFRQGLILGKRDEARAEVKKNGHPKKLK